MTREARSVINRREDQTKGNTKWVVAKKEQRPPLHVKGGDKRDVEHEPDVADVEALREAVHWLYKEKIFPRAVLVQWRLESRSSQKWTKSRLLSVAQAVPELHVMPRDPTKFNYSILLNEEDYENYKAVFADDDDSSCKVDERLWAEAARLFEVGTWPPPKEVAHQLYEVALWLRGQSSILCKVGLGLLLGMVRRGIRSQLLGYHGSVLVAYQRSDDYEKAANAKANRPTGIKEGELYAKEWKHLQWCLAQVLGKYGNELQIPALKMKFRDEHNAELSETAFGHISLMSLLRDERLGEVFEVEHQKGKESTLVLKLLDDRMVGSPFSGQAFGTVPPKGYEFLQPSAVLDVESEDCLETPRKQSEADDSLELVHTPPRKQDSDSDDLEVSPEPPDCEVFFGNPFHQAGQLSSTPPEKQNWDALNGSNMAEINYPMYTSFAGHGLNFSPYAAESDYFCSAREPMVHRPIYTSDVSSKLTQDQRFVALKQLLDEDLAFQEKLAQELLAAVVQAVEAEPGAQAATDVPPAAEHETTGHVEAASSEEPCALPWKLCIKRTFVNVEMEPPQTARARSSPPHGWSDVWPCMGFAAMDSTMDTATATVRMHKAD